jgi:hypothetical protein
MKRYHQDKHGQHRHPHNDIFVIVIDECQYEWLHIAIERIEDGQHMDRDVARVETQAIGTVRAKLQSEQPRIQTTDYIAFTIALKVVIISLREDEFGLCFCHDDESDTESTESNERVSEVGQKTEWEKRSKASR